MTTPPIDEAEFARVSEIEDPVERMKAAHALMQACNQMARLAYELRQGAVHVCLNRGRTQRSLAALLGLAPSSLSPAKSRRVKTDFINGTSAEMSQST